MSLRRSGFARCDKPSTTARLTIKAKTCKAKGCTERFIPRSMTHLGCSIPCAQEIVRAKREQAETKARQESRARDRKAREEMKGKPELTAEAQHWFNRARRLQELAKGSACISCSRTQEAVTMLDPWKPGGLWDCGHYMGVGAAPQHRFDPLNAWLQCKSCNAGSGKFARKAATVHLSYRVNLVALIGLEQVERLETDHELKHHTRDDLRAIRDKYRAMAHALEKRPA